MNTESPGSIGLGLFLLSKQVVESKELKCCVGCKFPILFLSQGGFYHENITLSQYLGLPDML